jgi:hypothetical protein
MSKKLETFTGTELKEIARQRAQAREKARRLMDAATKGDDAVLVARAESDDDNPPLTNDQLRRMRPLTRPDRSWSRGSFVVKGVRLNPAR